MAITTEDCVAYINEAYQQGNWKRKSKSKNEMGINRVFEAKDVPGVKVTVHERNGELSLSLRGAIDAPEEGKKIYYFDRDLTGEIEGEGVVFNIVSKDFWDKYNRFDDSVNSSNVKLPKGFVECMEGVFAYDGPIEMATFELCQAGLLPLPINLKPESNNGILFAIAPIANPNEILVWFASKERFLNKANDEDADEVLTYQERQHIFSVLENAEVEGVEIEDGADGFSMEYLVKTSMTPPDLQNKLEGLGFISHPKYRNWVAESN